MTSMVGGAISRENVRHERKGKHNMMKLRLLYNKGAREEAGRARMEYGLNPQDGRIEQHPDYIDEYGCEHWEVTTGVLFAA